MPIPLKNIFGIKINYINSLNKLTRQLQFKNL
jgi:hypothetical protein